MFQKFVSILESRGGDKNVPDECACKTMEAWHGLVCAILLDSACACVLASYSATLLLRRLVGATDCKHWESLVTRLITFMCLVMEAL